MQEKAEKYKRLGREPTYHEQWSELTFQEFRYCIKGQGTPEERYQYMKRHCYLHGKGCNASPAECLPECRYYPDSGRIEDEEAIEWLDKGKARLYPSCQLSVRFNSYNGRCCNDEDPHHVF